MQTHRDQLFFEAVYSALAAVIHEALGSFKTRQEVDVEVSPMSLPTIHTVSKILALRTETFNSCLPCAYCDSSHLQCIHRRACHRSLED